VVVWQYLVVVRQWLGGDPGVVGGGLVVVKGGPTMVRGWLGSGPW